MCICLIDVWVVMFCLSLRILVSLLGLVCVRVCMVLVGFRFMSCVICVFVLEKLVCCSRCVVFMWLNGFVVVGLKGSRLWLLFIVCGFWNVD